MAASRPSNPLRQLVGYQLRRASAAAMDELSRDLAAIGLRPTEASILVVVSANPRIKPSEVGRELGVQRANMTPLVTSLEAKGLIGREAVDGRSHGLKLTEAGRAACARALAAMRTHDEQLIRRAGMNAAPALAGPLERLWDDGGAPEDVPAPPRAALRPGGRAVRQLADPQG